MEAGCESRNGTVDAQARQVVDAGTMGGNVTEAQDQGYGKDQTHTQPQGVRDMERDSHRCDESSQVATTPTNARTVDQEGRYSGKKPKAAQPCELVELAEKQGYRCALSGLELTTNNSDLDHIVPVGSGGTHSIDNLQWVHRSINRMRGTLDVKEFVRLCQAVVEWSGSL
jgi:5-methylcytosine-specific restriction endonuclease McrA